MDAQKFNFAPKFPKNGEFSAPNFVFLAENFSTKRKFSGSLKFRMWLEQLPAAAATPTATTPWALNQQSYSMPGRLSFG